jgi:TPR repeat protein
MELSRPCAVAALMLGLFCVSVSAQGPREMSVYDLVDVGPVPVPSTCSCIGNAFAVPYRPRPEYGSGPATPLTAPPLSSSDRQQAVRERDTLGARADDGLAGNPNASLGVALQLSVESALAGVQLQTEEEALRWLHLAASQGHDDAFRLLGFRYAHGRGVAMDAATSAYWFRQGALRGDPISMTALGLLYAAGRGVPQNWPAAVAWWQRAQARAPIASRFAGDALACGLGVDPDPAGAVKAYEDAIKRGELSSSTQLGSLYANRCVDAPDEAAVAAYTRSADQGDPEAQVALSDLVREGRGVRANPMQAYLWARLAEERLAPGSLKTLAGARAKAAAALLSPNELAATELMAKAMLEQAATPFK